MIARIHHQKHAAEHLKVRTLLRLQRMLEEERDDALSQILESPHPVRLSITMVLSNHAATEERLECFQQLCIALVLHDGEFRKDLDALSHLGVLADPDMKASFTVHETCDPFCFELHWPIPDVKSLRVPGAFRVFPADCPRVRRILTARCFGRVPVDCMRSFP